MNVEFFSAGRPISGVKASITEREENGARIVRLSAESPLPLDPYHAAAIGLAIPDGARINANRRHSDFWCRSVFPADPAGIPDRTQGLIWEKDGECGVIWPIAGKVFKTVLCGGKAVVAGFVGGLTSIDEDVFVSARGRNVFSLLRACAGAIARIKNVPLREGRSYPELFEYPGWCSWDALEIRVCEEDLLKKAREFKEKNAPVRWCIIDDMWATVKNFYQKTYADRKEMFALMHSSPLWDVEADPPRFPHGLSGCIERLNAEGLRVGMWYPQTGYWCGIDPNGSLYGKIKERLLLSKRGQYVPDFRYKDARAYFDFINAYLKNSGADFVKIDCQSCYQAHYEGLVPVGEAASALRRACDESAERFFGDGVINCMGLSSEDVQNRPSSPVSRCSDDFLPDNAAWFSKHLTQCAFNSLFVGQFYWCDWDMWWTDDPQAKKNSLLRAVSGGPVYVSDMPGRTRPELILPLCGDDGRLLRCDRPGTASADCLFADPTVSGAPMKVQNTAGGAGYVAVFDLDADGRPVGGAVSPEDVDGLEGELFGVYEHFSGTFTLLKRGDSLPVTLSGPDDFRLYKLIPLENGCGVIGRTDKFISSLALTGGTVARVEKEKLAFADA